ncbi:hypothetical protein [Streptomyces sp. LaPpAH-108]|uniref:hypothetical protein n=1 Tax=Streptomyces sp. LaPpAH-108 TaxID=1155714 RepID=UPI001319E718|nr:hypothetical protein [Streptomyces sp. LaPpAH-108]
MTYVVTVTMTPPEGTSDLDALQREGVLFLLRKGFDSLEAIEGPDGMEVDLMDDLIAVHPGGALLKLFVDAPALEFAEEAAREVVTELLDTSEPLADWLITRCAVELNSELLQESLDAADGPDAPPADPAERARRHAAGDLPHAAPGTPAPSETEAMRTRLRELAPVLTSFPLTAFGYAGEETGRTGSGEGAAGTASAEATGAVSGEAVAGTAGGEAAAGTVRGDAPGTASTEAAGTAGDETAATGGSGVAPGTVNGRATAGTASCEAPGALGDEAFGTLGGKAAGTVSGETAGTASGETVAEVGTEAARATGGEPIGTVRPEASRVVGKEAAEIAAGALIYAIDLLVDELFTDLAALEEDGPTVARSNATFMILDDLPPHLADEYTVLFTRRLTVTAITLTSRLTRPPFGPPTCVAEKLLLGSLLTQAEVTADLYGLLTDEVARALENFASALNTPAPYPAPDSPESWFTPYTEDCRVHPYAANEEPEETLHELPD